MQKIEKQKQQQKNSLVVKLITAADVYQSFTLVISTYAKSLDAILYRAFILAELLHLKLLTQLSYRQSKLGRFNSASISVTL